MPLRAVNFGVGVVVPVCSRAWALAQGEPVGNPVFHVPPPSAGSQAVTSSVCRLSRPLSSAAFHILNNTTIQFKLEKIPIERESELTFSLSPDDLGTSSIMKIEGKFVNPVQVNTMLVFTSGQLKSRVYFPSSVCNYV